MVKISAVIPSYNRPLLVREALASVCDQQHRPYEIIIVDDASTPPIDEPTLARDFRYPVKVVRHHEQRGIAAARLTGSRAATGDVIVFCDDDDTLAPNALRVIAQTFHARPHIEVLFFNVRGFGVGADEFEERQRLSLENLMTRTRHSRSDQYLSVFDDTLFAGLLHSVPQAFQRTAATAGAWRRVASLRDRIYRRALQLSRDEDIIERLDNILTECEWALLAGLTCSSAFHHSPLYELRCHDERYYSRSELKAHHESANRRIKERLLLASDLPELCKFRPDIRSSVARGAFQAAYYEFESGSRTRAWRYLLDAARTDLKWQFVKFGVRTLLPRGIRKNF